VERDIDAATPKRRPLLGLALVVLAMAVLAIAWGEVFAPAVDSGFNVRFGPAGTNAVVDEIGAGSQIADRAALRVGDVIDTSKLTLSERYRLFLRYSPPGTTIVVTTVRAGEHRAIALAAEPFRSKRPRPSDVPFLISATVSLVVIALIAWRRPSLATAALTYWATGAITTAAATGIFSAIPDPLYGAVAASINAIFSVTPGLALLPFIVRFPHAPRTPAERTRMRIADALFVAGALVFTFQAIFEPVPFASWFVFESWIPWALAAIILAFALAVFRDAAGEERRRIGWVIVGLAVTDMGFAIFNVVDVGSQLRIDSVRLVLEIAQLMQMALPLALAYAILRHRVIDIGFALNRTAVYALTTTLVLALIGVVDWLVGRLLSGERFTTLVEALLTVAIGFGLNWLHGRIERLVDRIIFRQRHIAEKRIDYRIGALEYAESTASIDAALATDAPDILGLASAAVFLRASTTLPFKRNAATGWALENAIDVDPESLLVRSLRSLERAIFLDDAAIVPVNFPVGTQRPVLAIPIAAQHELIGFVLYGRHSDGASLDPEEVSLLTRLTSTASKAYGAVEARQWRERAAALEEAFRGLPSSPMPG
jgi:hypothetical protein